MSNLPDWGRRRRQEARPKGPVESQPQRSLFPSSSSVYRMAFANAGTFTRSNSVFRHPGTCSKHVQTIPGHQELKRCLRIGEMFCVANDDDDDDDDGDGDDDDDKGCEWFELVGCCMAWSFLSLRSALLNLFSPAKHGGRSWTWRTFWTGAPAPRLHHGGRALAHVDFVRRVTFEYKFGSSFSSHRFGRCWYRLNP